MALPSNIQFGKVNGRFMRAIADTPDDVDSLPEGIPITNLTFKFTASVTRVKNILALPSPVTVEIETVNASTDSEGYLVDSSGNRGVYLLASDSPGINPRNWTWKVTISGPSVPSYAFNIVVPANGTVDLTSAIPVTSTAGTNLDQWVQAVHDTQAARDAAIAAAEAAQSGGGVGLVPDPDNPGIYIVSSGLVEDSSNPGLYLIGA